MNNDIVQQGSFVSAGTNYTLKDLRNMDWLRIINLTETAADNAGRGVEYYWQKGMLTSGVIYTRSAAAAHAVGSNVGANIFQQVDMNTSTLGAPIALTNSTNAVQPVITTGLTAGLSAGSVVRLLTTGANTQTDLNGLDFTVDTVTLNTNFRLANTLATAPGGAPTTGTWRLVANSLDMYKLIKPSARVISSITQAASAVVTTLVDHGYSVGQRVKFKVPHSVYGMVEINDLTGVITAVSAAGAWPQTFTVNIDTTGFTAFTFPTIANITTFGAITNAQVFPDGQGDIGTYNYTAEDAITNQGFVGMILTAGVTGPAGSAGDAIYWQAGKSFNQ